MSNSIQNAVLAHLPSKRKTSTKGWISFNAVCCPHNGETMDKRGRGGVISNPDGGISYSCFNCNFKAGYVPGYHLSHRFRKLLKWLGLDESEIQQLSIDAMREQKRQELLGTVKISVPKEEIKVSFQKEPLPEEAASLLALAEFYELKNSVDYPKELMDAVNYAVSRKIDLVKYEFYWTPNIKQKMNKRIIIPFTWKNEIIGFSARALLDGITPKYIQHVDTGYVFNMDKQEHDWKFVIVCEGVFDALSVDGVAVLKGDVTKQQIDLIESLDREIIVVPDWNKSGRHLVDTAVKNMWSVSFPVWAETCEDINAAVQKYGKLFVLKAILDSVEKSSLKIELMRRKYV